MTDHVEGRTGETSLRLLLRRHLAGIVSAVALGVVLLAPRWYLLATSPSSGERVQLSPWGAGTFGYDQALYTPNIRQAFDGRWPIREWFGRGDNDTPVQTGALWLELIGWLGHLTGDIFSSLALVMTIAAIAAFLLFYALGVHTTRSRIAAIAVMPIALLCVQAVTQADTVIGLRHWPILRPVVVADPGLDFHAWARFVAPIMPLPAFFGAAIAVPRAAEEGDRRWIVLAAVCLAAMVYSYLFYWTAAALAVGLWTAWLLARGEYGAVRRLVVVGGLTVLIALPEFAAVARNAFTVSDDLRARLGIGEPAADDLPTWSNVIARFVIGLPFLLACLRGPERNRLYALLFVTPLALVRSPLPIPQPFHYTLQVWPAFAIPAVLAGSREMWLLVADARIQRTFLGVVSVLGVVAVGHFTTLQLRAIGNIDDAFSMRADESAAFDWIDANVSYPETVASPSITTNMYLAGLTPASRYLYDGFIADPSDEEIVDRYLRVSAAYGFSSADAIDRLDPIYRCASADDPLCARPSSNFPFKDPSSDLVEREAQLEDSMAYYLLNWEITHPDTIEERLPAWRETYADFLRTPDVLSKYRADYVYCGPRERLWPVEGVAPDTYVTLAFQQGEVTVYRLEDPAVAGARPFIGCE